MDIWFFLAIEEYETKNWKPKGTVIIYHKPPAFRSIKEKCEVKEKSGTPCKQF